MNLIVGQNNPYTAVLTVADGFGTLVISGLANWDLEKNSIVRIYSTTRSAQFTLTANTTFSNTFVSGLPTYTWVWPTADLPASSATSDTLLVYLIATPDQIMISLLQNLQA